MTSEFRLLVIADAHFGHGQDGRRNLTLGCELIRRAIDDSALRGGFDAIALMGDLLNDGDDGQAEQRYQDILAEIKQAAADTPLLITPGNHDVEADRMLGIFAARSGLHEIGGYRFFVFADRYGEGDCCTRSREDMQFLRDHAERGGGPIVALQHNAIFPEIVNEYPYMHTNRQEVLANYAEASVGLSISGHFHEGQPLSTHMGVKFFTAPVLCEPPFQYTVVTLTGRQVGVETRALATRAAQRSTACYSAKSATKHESQSRTAGSPAIFDCHAHTEFAYCSSDDHTADATIQRTRTFGVAGVCLTEHAPQLYCRSEDFWSARHIFEPDVWRSDEHSRMAEFRRAMEPLRCDDVNVGLEVELDCQGDITIHQDDRTWADLIVGAVHWLPVEAAKLSDSDLAEAFMQANRAILAAGVDVLAHPWRLFNRIDRPVCKDRYGALADLLARTGTAAEINFHTNRPDPDFFAACLERGVKIALSSDAHDLREAGAFTAHMDMLGRIAGANDLANILYYGRSRSD